MRLAARIFNESGKVQLFAEKSAGKSIEYGLILNWVVFVITKLWTKNKEIKILMSISIINPKGEIKTVFKYTVKKSHKLSVFVSFQSILK
jgi:hypothetical protein